MPIIPPRNKTVEGIYLIIMDLEVQRERTFVVCTWADADNLEEYDISLHKEKVPAGADKLERSPKWMKTVHHQHSLHYTYISM